MFIRSVQYHKHLIEWMARVELWQRERSAHWLGKNPHSALSWKLECMQPMQEVNHKAIADLGNWDL